MERLNKLTNQKESMSKFYKQHHRNSLTQWNKINWKEAYNFVSSKQNQLAIAAKRKDKNEIIRLQQQLLRSFHSRAIAVRRVVSSKGRKTSGIDKKLWNNANDKAHAISALKNLKEYKAQPVKRIWIDKPERKDKRPLGIPTLFDRAVQALDPIIETHSDPRSYGFRKYRSVRDVATYIKLVCGSMYGKRHVLEIDIKQFFPSINHEWLLRNTPMDPKILREFLKAGLIEMSRFSETLEGVPQGGVISPTLSNSILNGLEKSIKDIPGTYLVRYADDFVILGDNKPNLQSAKLKIEKFLDLRNLTIHEDKSKFSTIEEGFDFLGYNFREYRDKSRQTGRKKGIFLVQPCKKNVTSVLKKPGKGNHKRKQKCICRETHFNS